MFKMDSRNNFERVHIYDIRNKSALIVGSQLKISLPATEIDNLWINIELIAEQ